jgi:thiol-disulfide isomerase/thioredoxin
VAYLTLWIARDPSAHHELGLTAKQIAGVETAVAKVDASMWRLRDMPVAQCGEKLDELRRELRGGVDAVLTAEQRERLDQIILQARGFKAFLSGELAARLKLSKTQATELRAIVADAVEPRPSRDAETSTADGGATSQETAQKVLDVLSDEQSQAWGAMLGKRFDLSTILKIGCVAPELRGVDAWINSEPLTLGSRRDSVVAVHFWAFGCINCVHNLPHYQSWHEKFAGSGLTVIGIHTPETQHERDVDALRSNIRERGIEYAVAVDADAENWKAWGNNMWPSVYLIDKRGRVRYWWYGELNWQGARGEDFMREKIEALLAEK